MCYVPAQPEQSANYRVLWLLIVVTGTVAPWMRALMFIIHAPAAIFLGLVLTAFAAVRPQQPRQASPL